MEFLMDGLQYIANMFSTVGDFIAGIPDFIMEIFAYCWFWLIKLYISSQIFMVELAYEVAQLIFHEYEVYGVLNAAFNNLPDNLRYSAYQLGVVDAVRIVVDAMGTAFVLRIMGW
ncbi:hypothetical protein D8T51_18365 [Vibrio vulnificus]|uniref:hypothetical protein n=1 Tax=Vibrio vulnificus TaxID=672 RepID=UPI0010299BE3|nr:hypothetical protein [Vibrio vulnificus]RZP71668.1 hypothetical protein D8T60_23580 [Vibrio vulnificus]RZP73601.1 hypothetical protein D8T51_18365 [Vibrio vulnificus]